MALLADVHQRDTRANQPAATTVADGTLYYVTDEDVLERSNGTTWQTYSVAGGVAAHAATHSDGGGDDVDLLDLAGFNGNAAQVLRGDATWGAVPSGGTPGAHATEHEAGGGDPIQLDDLAAPSDNTDLDATTTAHGLLLKATAPAAGLRNVVAIDNGETAYSNKALVDTTNPEPLGTAAPGTQLVAARRDHVHLLPTLSTVADPTSSTRGTMLYRGAATWDGLAPAAAAGYRLRSGGAGADPSWVADEYTLNIVISGGGSAITTGIKMDVEVPAAGVITAARLFADQTGSIVLDLWKDTYANFPPVVGDSITASAKPTLSSASKSEDTTLTGWTTSVAAGDVIRVNVDSITTVTRVTLALRIRKAN